MPRPQKITDLLRYEAGRRPDVAALLDRAGELTDEEIAAAEVPMPWYRQALKMVRREIALTKGIVDGKLADPTGTMCRYDGLTDFFEMDGAEPGAKTELEVRSGALIWFPNSGGVWVDTAFSKFITPKFGAHNLATLGSVTRSGYQEAVRKQRHAAAGVTPDEEVKSPDPDDRGLFRIQRH